MKTAALGDYNKKKLPSKDRSGTTDWSLATKKNVINNALLECDLSMLFVYDCEFSLVDFVSLLTGYIVQASH